MQKLMLVFVALVGLAAAAVPWGVKDSDGKYCIVLEADTVLNLVYPNGNETSTCKVNVVDFEARGNCSAIRNGKPAQTMSVSFSPGENMTQLWFIDLVYTKTETGYELSEYFVLTSETPICPKARSGKFEMKKNASSEVVSNGSNGYKCSSTALPLVNGSSIDFKNIRSVAFASLNSTELPVTQVYDVCFLDSRTSDIVPIIVGACLAGLVIVVLVAYLIGRARAKRQGYASV